MKSHANTKVLFVCLGNICRSPAAEGIMKKKAEGLPIEIDSAGTAGYHIGELPDSRMRSHASKRGYHLTSRARQFDAAVDFEKFDYIVVMDENNKRSIEYLDRRKHYHQKISLMTEYCQTMQADEVPDPYYGGPDGFEHVLDILEDACSGLLKKIMNESSAP
ncbi:MAG: low molecular weight phosphotyrosine protein phosphatase [Bacteroidetes bacterium]|nr:low molecular weight phosphotyrosine protein phosphatase [Bacteroidota bacterium]